MRATNKRTHHPVVYNHKLHFLEGGGSKWIGKALKGQAWKAPCSLGGRERGKGWKQEDDLRGSIACYRSRYSLDSLSAQLMQYRRSISWRNQTRQSRDWHAKRRLQEKYFRETRMDHFPDKFGCIEKSFQWLFPVLWVFTGQLVSSKTISKRKHKYILNHRQNRKNNDVSTGSGLNCIFLILKENLA